MDETEKNLKVTLLVLCALTCLSVSLSLSLSQTYLLTLDVFVLTCYPLDTAIMLEAICNRSKAHLAQTNEIYKSVPTSIDRSTAL
jgi:diacylglycerol kinase